MTTTDSEHEATPPDEATPPEAGGGELVPAAASTEPVPAVIVPGSADDPRAHTAVLEPSSKDRSEALRTRVLLPLLLPLVSAAAIFFYVVNLSRALLAGGEWGSLVIASIITLAILGVVAWISAHPDLRTSTLAVMVAILFLFIGATGLTTIGSAENQHAEGSGSAFEEPTGDPVATTEVVAEATLKFNADNYDTVAGVNQIDYVLGGGTHTLVFEEKEFTGFELEVSPSKAKDSGKVELAAGTYTIYCTLPGHRAAGMVATVTVSGEAPAAGESTTTTTSG